MQLLRHDRDYWDVRMTYVDLATLGNCLNEVCNGIDVPEFETRIGVSHQEAVDILARISEMLNMRPSP